MLIENLSHEEFMKLLTLVIDCQREVFGGMARTTFIQFETFLKGQPLRSPLFTYEQIKALGLPGIVCQLYERMRGELDKTT